MPVETSDPGQHMLSKDCLLIVIFVEKEPDSPPGNPQHATALVWLADDGDGVRLYL
jgi:hypothetical protein